MTQQTAFFPLGGGMDLVTPMLGKSPGSVIAALNYEPVSGGYKRFRGFERFDGHTAPSAGGTRSSIVVVPGSGPVLGLAANNGRLYAVRDNAGGTEAKIYSTSFTPVSAWGISAQGSHFNFTSGGTSEVAEGTLLQKGSGSVFAVSRIVVQSGAWASGDAAGYIYVTNTSLGLAGGDILGISGGAADVLTVGTDIGNTVLSPGGTYNFLTHNFFGAANMSRIYVTNSVDTAFEFVISASGNCVAPIKVAGVPSDRPKLLAEHKDSLFLAYPGGSLQFSEVGEPINFSAVVGAGEIGIGDEIVGLVSMPDALVIFGSTSIHVLYGNDSSDYMLTTLTSEAGAKARSVQRFGDLVYADDAGARSLKTSAAYGNFTAGTLTQMIEPLWSDYVRDGVTVVASLVWRRKSQYWLFFSNGTALAIYLGSKNPQVMPLNLGITVSSSLVCEDQTGLERVFVGASNGYVYELGKGTSFDGSVIEHYLRLPFNHFGKPQQMKTINKVVLDVEVDGAASLGLTAEYDYGSVPGSSTIAASLVTGGGAIDGLGSNELYYASQIETQAEAYLDGICNNVSLKIEGSTSTENPHKLTGVTYFISWRGLNT